MLESKCANHNNSMEDQSDFKAKKKESSANSALIVPPGHRSSAAWPKLPPAECSAADTNHIPANTMLLGTLEERSAREEDRQREGDRQ